VSDGSFALVVAATLSLVEVRPAKSRATTTNVCPDCACSGHTTAEVWRDPEKRSCPSTNSEYHTSGPLSVDDQANAMDVGRASVPASAGFAGGAVSDGVVAVTALLVAELLPVVVTALTVKV
jgi:hypothetical protein